eukprot:588652-Amorphochlora_amoeboformis.AAC.2
MNRNDDNPITSIRWMNDGIHVAIGTTEKTIQIWNVENQKLVRTMKGHNARVSALSWNRHLLSSGGRDSLIINHDVRVATHRIRYIRFHRVETSHVNFHCMSASARLNTTQRKFAD